ncbi:MAG: MFS transporter [Bacteroidales bacterium]|nr:MFS transporter [Bacteroidales bacterium]MBO7584105.1 MFS transporter [Bacteroidales bacterium]MBP5317139.1 MFS transporter [Bacteroidales bacterium]
MEKRQNNISKLVPIMFAFFAMGFVDMVGTATNYVKADFNLSDTMANFLPSMVFLWFFFLSVPTSLLMNRIGKRRTVVLSLVVTASALVLPLCGYNYPVMLISFCLLGIGNTLMQVSLNPLISCVVKGDKLASSLTFGQFVKAIASFSAPLIASWAAVRFGNWRILYGTFLVIGVIATLYVWFTKIEEDAPAEKTSKFKDVLKLLGIPSVLMLFFGIVAHVGIDVGVNTCAPKILMERLGIPLTEAAIATSVYFLFRTIGCLTGSLILARWDLRKFFALSVVLMVLSMVGLFVFHSKAGIYVAIALVGYGNSNMFSMIFSKALLFMPERRNEMSGLMIMGLIGGTIFPILMGALSDVIGSQAGSVLVISLGVAYMIFLAYRFLKTDKE